MKNLELENLRQKIAEIDRQILGLIAKRFSYAKRSGETKNRSGLPIKNEEVEMKVLERFQTSAKEFGLTEEMAKDLAKLLIRGSILVQETSWLNLKEKQRNEDRKVIVVGGLGAMGQWFSEYFWHQGLSVTISDIKEPDHETAKKYNYVRDFSVKGILESHDIIMLCTPPQQTLEIIKKYHNKDGCLIEISSVKSPLIDVIREKISSGLDVISIHPMFGPGKDALSQKNVIFCRTAQNQKVQEIRRILEDDSFCFVEMDIDHHDKLISYILGLPHLLNLVFSYCLARSDLSFDEILAACSTTCFKQLSAAYSVVCENPEIYFAIQSENNFTPEILASLKETLNIWCKAIFAGDFPDFRRMMLESRQYLSVFGTLQK